MTQALPSNKLLTLSAKPRGGEALLRGQSKLLDSVREEIRTRHYSILTEYRVKVETASRGFNSRGILWPFFPEIHYLSHALSFLRNMALLNSSNTAVIE